VAIVTGMTHVELAIIGSGSGNTLLTPDLAGKDTAIVEESTFGGTCLNVGCIPTKMFVYPAGVAEAIREGGRIGVDATLNRIRWRDIRDRVFGRIDPISAGGREHRIHGTPNTVLIEAHASFLDPHTLALSTGEELTADQIVLATGSRPVVPDVITAAGVPFHTSETVMRIDELPDRVAIIGGGFIAAEFAHVFASFGVQTSVIARGPRLLRHLDQDISSRFTRQAAERWDVHLNTPVMGVSGGESEVRLELGDGSVVAADLLLVATGRQPNSDLLNLAAAGVAVHEDGRVVVDAHQRTTVEHIWALGDVCTPHQLKHVANHEARVVAHNLSHPEALIESDHRFVPSAVFTHPQVATVGLTEQQAQESGRPYVTDLQAYGSTAYGWAMEDTTSLCKLLADPTTGQLIGAHFMGEQAATLIQPVIQAMSFGLGVREMARGQYWIHPALTEVVENALLRLDVS
jgi:mycothione reductase